jgi:hypothetical protein
MNDYEKYEKYEDILFRPKQTSGKSKGHIYTSKHVRIQQSKASSKNKNKK